MPARDAPAGSAPGARVAPVGEASEPVPEEADTADVRAVVPEEGPAVVPEARADRVDAEVRG